MHNDKKVWRRLLRSRFRRLVRNAVTLSPESQQMIGIKRNILMNLLARLRVRRNTGHAHPG